VAPVNTSNSQPSASSGTSSGVKTLPPGQNSDE
jgi:hypothetical protein